MNPDILSDYVDRVYGYAVSRTYSREEADELAQEILYTAVNSLQNLRDEDRFEPWLWALAANVTRSFRRNLGKERAIYSYDLPELPDIPDESEEEAAKEELYDRLRTKIAMLSALYRDIIVLHYYDGLSTAEISKRLSVPEGTVRWRLAEGRRKLKKELDDMNKSALRPQKIDIHIYGNGNYNGRDIPFPTAYINDALSQNILYHCYEQACTVEQLAELCGVPAYYIEDRIDNLVRREALTESAKGKYLTAFPIRSAKHALYCEENAEKMLMPIMDRLLDALDRIAERAGKIGFYKAGKSETDLYYLYSVLAFVNAASLSDLPMPAIPKKYNGFEWNYIGSMDSGGHRWIELGVQQFTRYNGRGNCTYIGYNNIAGTAFSPMMTSEGVLNVCEDILRTGVTQDEISAAEAIEAGYVERNEDGKLFVKVPFFTIEQMSAFKAIAKEVLDPLMPEYTQILKDFIAGYKKLFPPQVSDSVDRICHGLIRGMLLVIFEYGQRVGRIAPPSPDCHVDVITEFRKPKLVVNQM